MIKIQIKNRWSGSILFGYEKENNTIKDTVVEAVRNGANLYGADLHGADLRRANLSGADLIGADLGKADLYEANLRGAYLSRADLSKANLIGADLSGTDLSGVYLYGANLIEANLYRADLRCTRLEEANFSGANLYGANLYGANNIPYIPLACPSDGAFIGWKKVNGYLIKLEIPDDAKRSSATTNKCRCDKAKVLSITNLYSENSVPEIKNDAYKPVVIIYKVGEMVFPDFFDDDRWNECSHGIHFFINKQDAINY